MITLPTTKLPATVSPAFVDNGGTMRSATNAKGLRLNRLGSHYRASVTMSLHKSEDAAPLIADLIAAKQEGLRMRYPLQGVNQSGSGAPVVDGAAQSGLTLKLRGLTPGYVVKKGFWLSIVNAGGQHYFHNVQVAGAVGSDGRVSIGIRPMLNYAFLNGAAVFLDEPMIEGEISGNEQSWQIVRGDRVVGIAFTIENGVMDLTDPKIAERQRYYAQQTEEAAERLRFSVGFAQSGLQALTLINGGALVALFTFVGSANAVKFDFHAMWLAFGMFAAGLALNIIAYLGAHFSQDQFYLSSTAGAWRAEQEMIGAEPTHDPLPGWRRGTTAQIVGIVAAVLALTCFIAGAGFALSGVLPR